MNFFYSKVKPISWSSQTNSYTHIYNLFVSKLLKISLKLIWKTDYPQDFDSFSDVNECDVGNGGCSQTCVNKPGIFECSCKSGYNLQPDQKTCSGNPLHMISFIWMIRKDIGLNNLL